VKTDGPSVCVVGAGAIGLCTALALARRGASRVRVIEARHPAAGSSGLSVGIVETQYLDPLDIELRVRSMRFFERLERDHGLGIVRNGYLRLGHTPEELGAFQRSVERQHALGVSDATALDREQIARLVPDLRTDDVLAGLFGPSDGFIDGHLYCTLLAELAAQAGVSLLAGHELLGAEPRPGGGVRLSVTGGKLDCDLVVDAAGPWAGRVAELLGYSLKLAPQRRQAVAVHLPRVLPYAMPSVMDYTPGGGEQGLYFRHEGPGRLIAGLHSEEACDTSADPDVYARAADEPFLEEVARKLAERLPSLADARLAGGWAGLYPVSPTGRPLVGPLAPGAPAIVAGGAGGSGIQLSPALGELAADWAVEGAPSAVQGAEALTPVWVASQR
jgi:sarcosine oxidase subunit beta